MNYEISSKILKRIEGSKKVLINCHRQPDADSVGSALALYETLKRMGKKVKVISPNSIPEELEFLPSAKKIETIDYKKFDFASFDLFILLDSSNWRMVTGVNDFFPPEIETIVIDHHKTNDGYGDINLVDERKGSTAEIIYLIIKDWKLAIDKNTANALLTGIIGDTGGFRYPLAGSQTLFIASELIKHGANKNKIIFNLYRNAKMPLLKFWGEVLSRMQLDEEHKFVWSAVPFDVYKAHLKPEGARESAASMFTQSVRGTDFGFVLVEENKRNFSISFRARTDFDVSKIAAALGGGGHRMSAGAKVENMDFDEAVEKVLKTARKFAKMKK